jgi:hypothetical protein
MEQKDNEPVMKKIKVLILVLFCGFGAVAQEDKARLQYADHVYDANIQTVLFYPIDGDNASLLDFPVIYIRKYKSLRLDFDELGNEYHNYNFKIIHCNHDWQPSILNDFEFLDQFNEFSVDQYESSLNTRHPYIHYSLLVPQVKVSGNYILKVYRNLDQQDVIITRRFVVYDSNIDINFEPKFALDPALRYSHQQIDFTLNYSRYNIFNANDMIKVVLRQNGRWDNAFYKLKPMFIKEDEKILDYHFYINENVFTGLNEYRGFDSRSIRFGGQNMAGTRFDNEKAEAYVMPDGSRNARTLSQWIDLNGRFVIDNFETRRGHVEADYVDTYFTLELNSPPDGDIYLFGLFSDWEIKQDFKLKPDASGKKFTGHVRCKQGFYNYSYVVVKPGLRPDETLLEGSYMQTENRYDVLVYFRPIGARYDHVIGYKEIDYNKLR